MAEKQNHLEEKPLDETRPQETRIDETRPDDKEVPLVEHLGELRNRLIKSIIGFIIATILCFILADEIFNILLTPYERALGETTRPALIYTAPQEYLFTQFKIALFGGLFVSFPLIAAQIYIFAAPGLYKNEKHAFLPFLIATPILFLIGALLVYFLIMPLAMTFFLSMQQSGEGIAEISLTARVSEYLSLIMTLIFAFGICFQLPIALILLAKAKLITASMLAEKRKYAIVAAFVFAAILTPPDPISQIGLALPTIGLYEISIIAVRIMEKKHQKQKKQNIQNKEA